MLSTAIFNLRLEPLNTILGEKLGEKICKKGNTLWISRPSQPPSSSRLMSLSRPISWVSLLWLLFHFRPLLLLAIKAITRLRMWHSEPFYFNYRRPSLYGNSGLKLTLITAAFLCPPCNTCSLLTCEELLSLLLRSCYRRINPGGKRLIFLSIVWGKLLQNNANVLPDVTICVVSGIRTAHRRTDSFCFSGKDH